MIYCGHLNRYYRKFFEAFEGCLFSFNRILICIVFTCFFFLDPISDVVVVVVYLIYFIAFCFLSFTLSHVNTKWNFFIVPGRFTFSFWKQSNALFVKSIKKRTQINTGKQPFFLNQQQSFSRLLSKRVFSIFGK